MLFYIYSLIMDYNIFVAPLIGVFSGLIGTYVMVKITMSDDALTQKLDMILSNITQDSEMQKKVYVMGGILGKGLRDGIGIDRLMPKKKGGLEGLIFELASSYFMGRTQQPESQMELIPPQQRQGRPEFG